jgi:hypothetical protein
MTESEVHICLQYSPDIDRAEPIGGGEPNITNLNLGYSPE